MNDSAFVKERSHFPTGARVRLESGLTGPHPIRFPRPAAPDTPRSGRPASISTQKPEAGWPDRLEDAPASMIGSGADFG